MSCFPVLLFCAFNTTIITLFSLLFSLLNFDCVSLLHCRGSGVPALCRVFPQSVKLSCRHGPQVGGRVLFVFVHLALSSLYFRFRSHIRIPDITLYVCSYLSVFCCNFLCHFVGVFVFCILVCVLFVSSMRIFVWVRILLVHFVCGFVFVFPN